MLLTLFHGDQKNNNRTEKFISLKTASEKVAYVIIW